MNLGIMLMLVTGIRVGELAALKWDDYDGNGLKIRRTETRYQVKKDSTLTQSKTFRKRQQEQDMLSFLRIVCG